MKSANTRGKEPPAAGGLRYYIRLAPLSLASLILFSERRWWGSAAGAVSSVCGGMAGGFDAGMGRLHKTCDAVSGAYMVIGLKYGSFESDNKRDPKELTYLLVREFTREFEARNGTTSCKKLLGVDFLGGDQKQAAERLGKVCPKMCRDAVEIVTRIIDQAERDV